MKNKFLKALSSALLILLFCLTMISASEAESPGEFVVEKVKEGLAILHDPTLEGDDMKEARRKKLWVTLEPVFNFKEISMRVLGPHWRDINDSQKDEFSRLFTNHIKNIYLQKSDAYSGEEIVFLRESVHGSRSKVQTHFITEDGKRIAVDFTMKKTGDNWQIYDVLVEGVSIVSNYRKQFDSMLKRSTFDELITKLKEKGGELAPQKEITHAQ